MDMRFLNEREELVLRTIIDEYIDTSEPVGSRNVSKVGPLKMSPATIRNIMSDLVDKGFIVQPHTSAGRVPTDSGYRYYIEKLVEIQNISPDFMEDIQRQMSIDPLNVMNLFRHFSKKLGEMTHAVGFIVSPKMNSISLKHIEFIRINKETVLAIIVAKTGMVQNVFINVDSTITDNDLVHMANFINTNYEGLSLYEVQHKILQELHNEKGEIRSLLEQAAKLSQQVFKSGVFDEEFIFEGMKYIIDTPELRQNGRLIDVLQAFEEKHHLCSLLEGCMKEDSVQIFIGSEIGLDNTEDLGMVIKPYHRGGKIVGTMGVIGPKRMRYSNVVSIVDYSSKIISKMLNDFYEGDK